MEVMAPDARIAYLNIEKSIREKRRKQLFNEGKTFDLYEEELQTLQSDIWDLEDEIETIKELQKKGVYIYR